MPAASLLYDYKLSGTMQYTGRKITKDDGDDAIFDLVNVT